MLMYKNAFLGFVELHKKSATVKRNKVQQKAIQHINHEEHEACDLNITEASLCSTDDGLQQMKTSGLRNAMRRLTFLTVIHSTNINVLLPIISVSSCWLCFPPVFQDVGRVELRLVRDAVESARLRSLYFSFLPWTTISRCLVCQYDRSN